MNKHARVITKGIVITMIIAVFCAVLLTGMIRASTSGSSDNANLTIFDETDSGPNQFTVCDEYCSNKGKTNVAHQNIIFFANFTNSTGSPINQSNGAGTVQIQFNENGTWTAPVNMTYDAGAQLWNFTANFTHKGTLNVSMSANSTFGNVTLYEPFVIANTIPFILKDPAGRIDFDYPEGNGDVLNCVEDTLCVYNFSANVSEDDVNDILTFGFNQNTNTTLTNFTLNATTGMLLINYTNEIDIGANTSAAKTIELTVTDTESPTQGVILDVNVTARNDPPLFANLGGNRTITNHSELFELILQATDEENDLNLTFNVSFLSCTHRSPNPPTGQDNCTLFNLTEYNETAANISFTPQPNQKGEYQINFSVTDARNATYSEVVNWTLSWSDPPLFTYICDNERTATEGTEFTCYINVTDPDEINNLTFIANYTWFTFNGTQTNATTIVAPAGNASALVNFTAQDEAVGNWSVNITVFDTGDPAVNTTQIASNSTVINFFVNNINDSVTIVDIQDFVAFTSLNYSILINATDDDLLIPDKSVYNETLTFTANHSAITITNYIQGVGGSNRTDANLTFDPNDFGGVGNYSINLTVRDANNHSIASDVFTIEVSGNNAPQWDPTTQTTHVLTENVAFSLNLSQNVSDADPEDTLTFSSDESNFDSFSLDANTGVISFTPIDIDVGEHLFTITVTDGKTPASLSFNFTVQNVPDAPGDLRIIAGANASVDNTFNITAQEDNATTVFLRSFDDDFRIPDEQSSFYDESHTVTLTIQGPNTTLINFDELAFIPALGNGTQASATFTPRKGDIGNYNVTINVTDASGASTSLYINMTILESQHAPNLTTPVGNQIFSINNETFYFDVNASDLEDGTDTGGDLTFVLQNLTANGNFLSINATTGVINFTFNQTYAGHWQYFLTVNDTTGSIDTEQFNVTVYDYPMILFPNASATFNFKENVTALLNFTANHTVQDDLNYTLIINGMARNSTFGYGNATPFLWNFTANFTDATCIGAVNFTLNVSNAKLSNTTTWSLTVNHTNAPLIFTNTITDQSGGSPITLSLANFFSDIDAADPCINQTIIFSENLIPNSTSGGAITVDFHNWESAATPNITFSAGEESSANYSITAIEYNGTSNTTQLSNVTSNNFSVSLTVSETTTTVQSGGGGGGSSQTRIVSLKILVPEPVSAKQKDRLVIPLGLVNDGAVDLNDILLEATIAKDGLLRTDLQATFDQSTFTRLNSGDRENVTLVVDIDTSETGLFEVTINATVDDPEYTDWAKFFIEIEEERDVLERIIFTEEFIIGNPQCAELVDVTNEAKALHEQGMTQEALEKSEGALEACKQAIAQPPSRRVYERVGDEFLSYTAITSLGALGLGFGYYYFRKLRLKRQLQNYQ